MPSRLAAVCSAALGLLSLGVAGCSSESTAPPSATPDAGGSDGSSDAAGDASAAVNGCTSFEDHTAAGDARKLTWDLSIGQATARCMQVKVGQTVTFAGNFTSHPLGALGGDSPNPVGSAQISGDVGTVTFTAAGTFGFVCQVHPSMIGAVRVVP